MAARKYPREPECGIRVCSHHRDSSPGKEMSMWKRGPRGGKGKEWIYWFCDSHIKEGKEMLSTDLPLPNKGKKVLSELPDIPWIAEAKETWDYRNWVQVTGIYPKDLKLTPAQSANVWDVMTRGGDFHPDEYNPEIDPRFGEKDHQDALVRYELGKLLEEKKSPTIPGPFVPYMLSWAGEYVDRGQASWDSSAASIAAMNRFINKSLEGMGISPSLKRKLHI